MSENQSDWDIFVPYVLVAAKSTTHHTTHQTPYFMLYLCDVELPFDCILAKKQKVQYNLGDFHVEMHHRLVRSYEAAKIATIESRQKYTKQYNKKTAEVKLKVGDLVLLHNTVVAPGLKRKFRVRWTGPYRITRQPSAVTFMIRPLTGGKH